MEENSGSIDSILELMRSIGSTRDPMEVDTESTIEQVKMVAKDSKPIQDAYGNPALGIGNQDQTAKFDEYGFTNDTLNWTLWLSLYQDSWVFKRCIDKPAQDEIRCGVTIHGDFKDKDRIYTEYKKHTTDLIQLLKWGGLFGGSIACIMFDGMSDEDYSKPLFSTPSNMQKLIKSKVMRFYTVDRWYGVAPTYNDTVDNMSNIDFGKPKYYTVTMADGHTVKFHHDYVLRYEHRDAPKLVKSGMLQGWGYAEGSHIMRELMRDSKMKASIQSLVDKALIEVIKMPGMRGIFMGGDTESNRQIERRLEMVNWGRNFNSLTFLDTQDEYQQNTFSALTGLSDILEQNMWLISAALEMQGVLFGDLKQGFSNDTDALERYDQTILGRCEDLVRPVLEKYFLILYKKFGITEKVDFDFNSILAKKKTADKVESISQVTDLCSKMLNDGVIDLAQYANALKSFLDTGDVVFNFDDATIAKLKEEQNLQTEGFNFEENEPSM